MDKEIESIRFNINQLAGITGLHRQTISSRLKNVEPAPGSNARLKLYALPALLCELMKTGETFEVDQMTPPDRKAWFQSERERLKFQQEVGELIPADDVVREFSSMAKAVIQILETLPDILERDCALQPAAVMRVQSIIDDLRDNIAQKIIEADTPDNTEEDATEED
ncbi:MULTISPECIES: DUF1441 family protein [unclassified Symbiopectobacterium]|uniref:DUF1441 family protein n=1 Tax=unclassified Symbiopectobacterium TaxID=2794573 RepID=UPI00222635A6|nr:MULTISPECIES: DUF1441 family protein [unclassified Symbiopectobacterium]MCW2473413.1 DUF1441 family protein [Candidatus Symbiopectobacterium sp. NZEC151]MCW2482263.1 DUF1441 family protein [Candidatus Symbiopectobacterium sp. NZEC135]